MANTYPIISPATLPNLLSAVKQDGVNTSPLDTEAASVLGSVDRQTRQFVYDYLSSIFNNDGTLKQSAINTSTTLSGLITAAMLVNNTITAAQIANGTITTTQISSTAGIILGQLSSTLQSLLGNVLTTAGSGGGATTLVAANFASIAGNIIPAAALVNNSITNSQIANGTITDTQISSSAAITISKLANQTAGYILMANASGVITATQISGALSLSSAGVASLTTNSFVELAEQAASGTNAGASSATTTQLRGNSASVIWTQVGVGQGTNPLVSAPTSAAQIFLIGGTYDVQCTVPGFGVGKHKAFVQSYSAGGVLQATLIGTSETALTNTQTSSTVVGTLTVPTSGYITVTHYTTAAVSSDGLGQAVGLTSIVENYGMIKLTKIA